MKELTREAQQGAIHMKLGFLPVSMVRVAVPDWGAVKIRDFPREHPHKRLTMYPNAGKPSIRELRAGAARLNAWAYDNAWT
jgi:hypothetical protein